MGGKGQRRAEGKEKFKRGVGGVGVEGRGENASDFLYTAILTCQGEWVGGGWLEKLELMLTLQL